MKKRRALVALALMAIGFASGMYLGFANHAAKAMNYDVVQALEMLPAPVDYEFPIWKQPQEPEMMPLGTFTVTGYCPCEICCGKWSNMNDPKTASGVTPTELITVGADWDKLAAGTSIYIDGVGERIVEDKVAGWISDKYDGNILDIFFFDHQDALEFGKQELGVWEMLKEESL